jgi:hypothetical protein
VSGIAPWLVGMGCIGCAIAGFLIGRNALKAEIEKRVKKEIYEQGKLDGAFEFICDSLFASITKH